MSQYYNPLRTRNLYNPNNSKPFKLSRSKIDAFLNCPRCFYLDRRLGVAQPPGYPFTLNSAVDFLLKQEFDVHRAKGEAHPLMKKYKIDAVPIPHEKLDEWRENFKGVQYHHKPTNLIIIGAIDDLWQNPKGEFIVVDYKATSKNEAITELNQGWHKSYKRQMEIYQWLLRKNKLKVSDTGYFVYCNGKKDKEAFDAKLEFDITLIAYKGKDSWVEQTIKDANKCLNSRFLPDPSAECDYCAYRQSAREQDKYLSP